MPTKTKPRNKAKRTTSKQPIQVEVIGEKFTALSYEVESVRIAVQKSLNENRNQGVSLAWIAIGIIVNLVAQTFYLYMLTSKH
jgi:hypothetical protein